MITLRFSNLYGDSEDRGAEADDESPALTESEEEEGLDLIAHGESGYNN